MSSLNVNCRKGIRKMSYEYIRILIFVDTVAEHSQGFVIDN